MYQSITSSATCLEAIGPMALMQSWLTIFALDLLTEALSLMDVSQYFSCCRMIYVRRSLLDANPILIPKYIESATCFYRITRLHSVMRCDTVTNLKRKSGFYAAGWICNLLLSSYTTLCCDAVTNLKMKVVLMLQSKSATCFYRITQLHAVIL